MAEEWSGARVEGSRMDGLNGEETGAGSESERRVQTLPLNSRRLTASVLRQLAGGLGVPTTATQADLRPMIEGELTGRGRDPLHVQVVLRQVARGAYLSLQDETGVFVEVEPPEPEEPLPFSTAGDNSESEEDSGESEVVARLQEEVRQLKQELEEQKVKTKNMWKLSCEQLAEMDDALAEKDDEISHLRVELDRLHRSSPGAESASSEGSGQGRTEGRHTRTSHLSRSRVRRGKAPPVDTFTGEDPESRFDDWLPTLKRAADWNEWTADDLLIQLAGHLKGRALQEWNLLSHSERERYELATAGLRSRLDPGSRIMAAQDFRHAAQEESEKVSDFIRRLEQLFKLAYGHDTISAETRNTLLYGQLQEGLKFRIMEAPAVSGAADYQALCLAAKAEEKRLAELRKWRQYRADHRSVQLVRGQPTQREAGESNLQPKPYQWSRGGAGSGGPPNRKCWNCGKPGHIASECRTSGTRSPGRPDTRLSPITRSPRTQQVQSLDGSTTDSATPPGREKATSSSTTPVDNPLQYLLPDSDEEAVVRVTRVPDKGSRPQTVCVEVGGVPVRGVVDTGADITIVGAEAFKRIAAVARLHRCDFKPADRTPRTYDQKTFHIDGRVDLDITFERRTMKTPVYVKMDASEQLLLSEGACRQLGIVTYHDKVVPG